MSDNRRATMPLRIVLLSLAILFYATTAIATDFSHSMVFDLTPEAMEAAYGKQPISALSLADSLALASYRFEGDTVKLMAVLVEWDGRPATYSRETFDSVLFSRNVYPGGSVADYFNEVSYGKVTLSGQVFGWYNVGPYDPSYDFSLLFNALANLTDLSQFDGNHDGYVDAITFIRAGTGQEDSGDPNDIWSYAIRYPPGYVGQLYDGVMINAWNTCAELRPLRLQSDPTYFSGIDTLNIIRVYCHELSHNLGLPDLYDYDSKLVTSTYVTPGDDNDHPLVDWCLMGYYGYGVLSLGSVVPSHLCGWSKYRLGWIEPTDLTGIHENLAIASIETSAENSLYRVPIDEQEGEYFLLEYRNPRAAGRFDKLDSDFSCYLFPNASYGADTLDRGLLITHVHDSVGSGMSNNGTPAMETYMVTVVDAGYDPSRDINTNPNPGQLDTADWWYPLETRRSALFSSETPGQERLGPNTYPSSDGYGGPTGIDIRVDSIVGDTLYAYVYNPYQCVDSDGDFYGDPGHPGSNCLTDNCPDVYNPDQADSDGDGIGDACESCCGRYTSGYTGNTDCDTEGTRNLSDVTRLIDRIYLSRLVLCCEENGDTSGDGQMNLSDVTRLIDNIYLSKNPTEPCP